MQQRATIHSTPFARPEGFLATLFAVLLVMLGLSLSALVLGLALAAGLGLAARFWWTHRRLRRDGKPRSPAAVIEGEYRVLERHSSTGPGGEVG